MSVELRPPTDSQPGVPTSAGNWYELLSVFGLTVGLPVILTIRSGHLPMMEFNQARLARTLAAEAVAAILLWPMLANRGWNLTGIAGQPRVFDLARGLGVALLAYAAGLTSVIAWYAAAAPTLQRAIAVPVASHVSLLMVVTVCVLNPLFEEFLWLAYGFTALNALDFRVALLGSVFLRVLVHYYQGLLAAILILPIGVVFTEIGRAS